MPRLPLLLLLLLLPALARAEVEEFWFRVSLDAQTIGHMHSEREVVGDRVRTRQRLELTVRRGEAPLPVTQTEEVVETRAGRPLAFRSELDVSGNRSSVIGEVDREGRVRAELNVAGKVEQRAFDWPRDAVLAEGQRLAQLAAGWSAGTRGALLSFDIASLRAWPLEFEVLGQETLAPAGVDEALVVVRQTLRHGDSVLESMSWQRMQDALPRRLRMPALGLMLQLDACARRCDDLAIEPADVLAASVLAAPRALGVEERLRPLRYRLRLEPDAAPAPLGMPAGQYLVATRADGAELIVDPAGGTQPAPSAADRRPTRWLQSDDPKLREFAVRAVGRQRDPLRRMQRLEAAVRTHIATKSLRIGYASASEALALREGDCTEHALLLAALARALDIPARVATGLAYAPGFHGRKDVFVPHSWVLAFVEGRWQGFDAALPRFDAGHIALALGDGDPLGFYAGIELLGRLHIEAVDALRPREWRELRRALADAGTGQHR